MSASNGSTTREHCKRVEAIPNLTRWNIEYQMLCQCKSDTEVDGKAKFHRTVPAGRPETYIHALFYKKVTELILDDSNLRRQWHSYWLDCCRSDKCNYIFNVLADCGIDREEDIAKIITAPDFYDDLSIREKKGYLDPCINYLLRRYSLFRAFRLWWKYKPAQWRSKLLYFIGVLRFTLPRLWGAIIVGILFLMGGMESMELPTRLYDVSVVTTWILVAIAIFIAFIYLNYECGKNTEYGRGEALIRSTYVTLLGLLESAAISAFFVHRIIIPVHRHTTSTASNPITIDFWITWGAFTVAAFLIGIFLQSFWEEKTIAEPL